MGTQTAIDLSPIIIDSLAFAGILLAALAGWGIKKYIGIKLDVQATALLDKAIENGINYALNKAQDYVAGHPVKVDLHNEVIAVAGNYAVTHAPEELARLGVTQQVLAEKIIARLPQ